MTTHAHDRGARAAHPTKGRAAADPPSRKKRRVRVLPFLALLIMALGVAGSVGPYLDYRRVETERRAMEAEVALLDQENQAIQKQIDRLGYPSYMETLARTELGLALPGEDVFIVPEAETLPTETQTEETEAEPGPLERALSFILDVF